MGSNSIGEFVVAFTIAVTDVSEIAGDMVAKNGKHMLFSVLMGIFPEAMQL